MGENLMNDFYISLTLQEVCHSAGLNSDQLLEIIEQGIIEPEGEAPEQWLFSSTMLCTARRASRLHYDLDLEWSAIALVLDLLQEKEHLQRENAMLRQRLQRFFAD